MYFDKKNIIERVIEEGVEGNQKKTSLDIAYGVDENFLFGAAISMTSILINNQDIDITFHLFTDYIDDEYCEKIRQLVRSYNTHIYIYIVNNECLKQLPYTQSWSHAMYFRFIAFDYLASQLETLLYLDADIMCKGSLSKFADIDLSGHDAAVVKELDSKQTKLAARLELEGILGNYFNSGMIYANLKNWEEKNLTYQAMTMLNDPELVKKLYYYDQDVLNILFLDKVIFLNRNFNYLYSIGNEIKNIDTESRPKPISEDTILIHYIGATKPWHEWARYPSSHCFEVAHAISPWSDTPLKTAVTAKQYKRRARHYIHQGKIKSGIMSYFKYAIKKIFV